MPVDHTLPLGPGRYVTYTPDKLQALIKAYDEARAVDKDTFMFEGHEYVADYAKYLIEFLSLRFGGVL